MIGFAESVLPSLWCLIDESSTLLCPDTVPSSGLKSMVITRPTSSVTKPCSKLICRLSPVAACCLHYTAKAECIHIFRCVTTHHITDQRLGQIWCWRSTVAVFGCPLKRIRLWASPICLGTQTCPACGWIDHGRLNLSGSRVLSS